MGRKVIIVIAPVGSPGLQVVRNPLTPEQIADEVVACSHAGAAMAHLHVRDETGAPTADLAAFAHTLDIIRENSDIIIEASTGGISPMDREQRCAALNEPRVEVASLNTGSVNIEDTVYVNTLPEIRLLAQRMKESGVRPELVAFEGGMIHNAEILAAEGYLDSPLVFGLALGFRGGLPARSEALFFLRHLLPQGSSWGLVHHQMPDMSLLAVGAGMGASALRVGFEDSVYHAEGETAISNVELVERLVALLGHMGLQPATASEARMMLDVLKPPPPSTTSQNSAQHPEGDIHHCAE